VEINGMVSGGRLQMRWGYSREVHRRETVQRVAEKFVEVLRELILHCRRPDAGGFTPSDFPEATLSQRDLDELIAELS
jgi:non-ribosomal peptide synthase protein (TIGR01720 family)